MFGDEIERIMTLHPLTGEILTDDEEMFIFPATHYVASPEQTAKALSAIEVELMHRVKELESQNKLLEAQRIKMRTAFDLEMIRELGFVQVLRTTLDILMIVLQVVLQIAYWIISPKIF